MKIFLAIAAGMTGSENTSPRDADNLQFISGSCNKHISNRLMHRFARILSFVWIKNKLQVMVAAIVVDVMLQALVRMRADDPIYVQRLDV